MKLKGSCHCQKVKFEIETQWIYPFMRYYCKMCRKTNGGPISVYLKTEKKNLKIICGKRSLAIYRIENTQRYFCKFCSSPLYFSDSRHPKYFWPNASSIDTKLPKPSKHVHIFVPDKAEWFPIDTPGPRFKKFSTYTIDGYHKKWDLNLKRATKRRSK